MDLYDLPESKLIELIKAGHELYPEQGTSAGYKRAISEWTAFLSMILLAKHRLKVVWNDDDHSYKVEKVPQPRNLSS